MDFWHAHTVNQGQFDLARFLNNLIMAGVKVSEGPDKEDLGAVPPGKDEGPQFTDDDIPF